MPGIRYIEQNLFPHRLCSTKPIPGIRYVRQNHIWDLVVKTCLTRCFPSKKIISEIK